MANRYSLNVIDGKNCGIDSDYDKYTKDGLHPNEEGHKLIAEYILRSIDI